MLAGLGARLRDARLKTGLNQSEFGKLGGVSGDSQGFYEADKTPPKIDYFAKLECAGVDISFVLLGTIAAESLTAAESEIITNLRSLTPEFQASVAALLAAAVGQRSDSVPAPTLHDDSRSFRTQA